MIAAGAVAGAVAAAVAAVGGAGDTDSFPNQLPMAQQGTVVQHRYVLAIAAVAELVRNVASETLLFPGGAPGWARQPPQAKVSNDHSLRPALKPAVQTASAFPRHGQDV